MDSLATEADKRKRMRTDDVNSQDQVSSSPPSQHVGADQRTTPQPKRVACTNCRQSKLRCDSPKNPCSRCARLGLTCTTDTGYKRISKKSKIDELEEHLQQLKAVIDQNANTSNSTSPTAFNGSDSSSRGPAPLGQPHLSSNIGIVHHATNIPPSRPAMSNPQIVMPSVTAHSNLHFEISSDPQLSRPSATKARALESVVVEKEQIDILFLIYFQNFHPYFPLLDAQRSPDEYYEKSPVLFWTIIAVAARRYATDPALLVSIAAPVRELIWKRISEPPLILAEMQGLLVYCIWPANTMRMWTDASMTFCNVVLSSALHMGLHRPNYARDFAKQLSVNLSEAEINERMNTWCACNVVNQFMTFSYGYPPVGASFDWSIERAIETANPFALSENMRFLLITQRFCNRVMKVMSGNVSDPLGMPSENEQFLLLDILEHDLDAMTSQWGKPLTSIQLVYFHAVRLYLHVFYWLGDQTAEQQRTGLLKSYATAESVIRHFISADANENLCAYCPMWLLLVVLSACNLISKITNSNLSQYVDVESGSGLVQSGLDLLGRFSVSENDLPQRALKLLSEQWAHRDDDPLEKLQAPSLLIKSRLGASMCYDCLFKWRFRSLKRVKECSTQENNAGVVPPTDPNNSSFVMPQTADATNFLPMNWDPWDDLNWNFDFDIPIIPPTIPLTQ